MFGHPVADPFDQPLQKPMRISQVSVGSKRLQVRCRELLDLPFVTLRAYSHAALDGKSAVLAIPPLSGHFPVLFHDCIVALLENHEVYVAEWKNVRHIHLDHGPFSFEDNIDYIVRMISAIGPNLNVIGLCQSAVPTLAAVAAINRSKQPLAPQSLVLLGGPIDPLANPTRVVALLRERSLDWFQSNVIKPVSSGHSGVGRFVYPAHVHLSGLLSYLTRHIIERGELSRKIAVDDGTAPKTHPFMSLYTSLMDLPAVHFLENIQAVYHERRVLTGGIRYRAMQIEPEKISRTALMTVEGNDDDIAAPGQTFAAHKLCPNISDDRREHLVVEKCGHFSLFHGRVCREVVVPEIESFISRVSNRS